MDEHLVVVDKPHFLPMIPTGRFLHETLLVRLKKKLGEQDLTPIHRLDRETAGVVIFSRRQDSRGAYQSMFQKRVIEKEYEALAPRLHGRDFPFTYRSRMVDGDKFFIMKEEAGEPNSETLIDVIEHRADCTLYRLHPHTGRKHQLRVHLSRASKTLARHRPRSNSTTQLLELSIRWRCRASRTTLRLWPEALARPLCIQDENCVPGSANCFAFGAMLFLETIYGDDIPRTVFR